MRLLQLLTPDQYVETLAEIDLEDLGRKNIEAIICDLDNTLVPWGSEEISSSTVDWLEQVHDRFKVAIVSNAMSDRVMRVSERLGVPAVGGATKPRRQGYRRVLKTLSASAERTAVVGDQLFTDILGGNRMGMCTILVLPLSGKDFLLTRIVRFVERQALDYLQRRGCTEHPGRPSTVNGKRQSREG